MKREGHYLHHRFIELLKGIQINNNNTRLHNEVKYTREFYFWFTFVFLLFGRPYCKQLVCTMFFLCAVCLFAILFICVNHLHEFRFNSNVPFKHVIRIAQKDKMDYVGTLSKTIIERTLGGREYCLWIHQSNIHCNSYHITSWVESCH